MTESHATPGIERQFAFFMDLLSHDILNNNQAVLSYLELVLANPDLDAKVRDHAEKAISHVRTSTALVEHAKNLMVARTADTNSLRPVDLMRTMMLAIKELPRFFSGKRVRVRVAQAPTEAYVLGGPLADDLVLTAFTELARTDPGDEVDIDAKIVKSDHNGKMCWTLVLSDQNAVLQPGMMSEDLSTILSQDNSKMVKMAGYLFARIASRLLGGELDAKEIAPGATMGGQFNLTLLKAGRP